MPRKVRLPTHHHDGLNGDRKVSLSAERLALVQRYMVDAEEAKALELRAVEEQARREVEERLAREADRRRVLAEAAERRAAALKGGPVMRPQAQEAAAPAVTRLPAAPGAAPPVRHQEKRDARTLKALEKADRRAAKEAARQAAAAERREARERKALAKAIAKRQARERKELAKLMAKRGT